LEERKGNQIGATSSNSEAKNSHITVGNKVPADEEVKDHCDTCTFQWNMIILKAIEPSPLAVKHAKKNQLGNVDQNIFLCVF